MTKWWPVERGVMRSSATKYQSEFVKIGRVVALGREPPQNSRDNHDKSGRPVRMRYTWGTCKDAKYIKENMLTNTWLSHATLPDNNRIINIREIHKTVESSGMPFLLVEDYNTTGLTGQIDQMWEARDGPIMKENSEDQLFWFLRVINESTRRAGRGGSHGMGKMAFPASSDISSMFVVSSRRDVNNPRFLCGQTFLQNYFRNSKPYGPEFYFGGDDLLDERSGYFWDTFRNHGTRWLPEIDTPRIERFCSVFGIGRAEDEYGTSVMIPFPYNEGNDSITPERMQICILTNYTLAIAKGLIEFEFVDRRSDESNPEISILDSSNLRSKIMDLDWDAYRGSKQNAGWSTRNRMNDLMDLIDALSEPLDNRVIFPINGVSQEAAPTWQQDNLLPKHDDEGLVPIRSTLQSGGVIHVECNDIPIIKKDGTSEVGSFRLVLKNATDPDDAEAHFYRSHISLPGNLKRGPGHTGISSLLVLEESDPLAEMMRISEGAAHMFWDPMAPQLRADRAGDYYHARDTISFLKDSIDAVMGRVSKTSTEAEPFLNEFFGSRARLSRRGPVGPVEPPDLVDSDVDVSPRKSTHEHGFVIKSTPDARDLTGEVYIVRLGYNKTHPEAGLPNKIPDARIIDIRGSYSAKDGASVESVESQQGGICPDRFMVRVNAPAFRVVVTDLDLERQARAVVSPFRGGD